MGEFSLWHLIIILVIVLIFFGPQRLPGLGNSIGKAIRGFKDGMKGMHDPVDEEKSARTAHEALPPSSSSKVDSTITSETSGQTTVDKNKTKT